MSSTDPIAQLLGEAEADWRQLMAKLGADAAELEAALEPVRLDADAAIRAGNLEHLGKLRHEVKAILAERAIVLRGETREQLQDHAADVLAALWGLLAKGVARATGAAVLLLGLALGTGCVLLQPRGTVPSSGVRGLTLEVCSVAADCAQAGRIAAVPEACRPENAGSLVAMLAEQRTVDGAAMAAQLDGLCSEIEACLATWTELEDYLRRSYGRWCPRLEAVAAAAIAE